MASVNHNPIKSRPTIQRKSSVYSRRKSRRKSRVVYDDYDNLKSRYYVPSLDKQILFQDIVKQFEEWPSWQKNVILCKFTEKSSNDLLSTLSTVLEPIFHRDFEITSKNGFQSSLIKSFLTPVNSAVTSNNPLTNISSTPLLPTIVSSKNGYNSSSPLYINKETVSEPSLSTTNDEKHPGLQISTTARLSLSPNTQRCQHRTILSSSSGSLAGKNYMQIVNLSRRFSRNMRRASSTISIERNQPFLPSNVSVVKEPNICLGNQIIDLKLERGTSHSHAIDRNRDSLSTIEFIQKPKKDTFSRLGTLMKPTVKNNADVCVKEYKHYKWWLPPIQNKRNLQKVSKRDLLRSFKTKSDEFIRKYTTWSNAEKGDLMLHIVDVCLPQEIMFFATCIFQRLAKFNSINNISDDVLLKIFSYLQPADLKNIENVSKHWKYLSSCQCIWKRKCYQLAFESDQYEIINNLQLLSTELDWKQLYNELVESMSLLELNKSLIDSINTLSPDEKKSEESINTVFENNSHDFSHNNSSTNLSEINVISEEGSASIDLDDDTLTNFEDVQIRDTPSAENRITGVASNWDMACSSHISFSLEKEEISLTKQTISMDGNNGGITSESPTNIDKPQNTQKEDDNENEDVALDVRVKLVQAPNQIKSNTILFSRNYHNEENDEYQLIPVSNIKSVKHVRKLEGHNDTVLCLQFDAKRVMTGSADRTVKLWDIRSGRYFYTLEGHQGGVRCLKFDEKYIFTGSWDTTVMIWDVICFRLIHVITDHSNCVTCIEISPYILITASHDTTVCIFKKHSWQLLSKLQGHQAPVSCMALISTNELLTGSHDRVLLLWNLDDYLILRKFEGAKSSFLSVKVCGSLVAAGATDGSITFWNLLNGYIEGIIMAHEGAVNSLCFVDSRFFSAGGDNVVKEWDLATCTCLRSLRGHTGAIHCLRASMKRVVSGSADGTSRIWDMTSKLQQVGGHYDELNKTIIQTQILNEQQFKKMNYK